MKSMMFIALSLAASLVLPAAVVVAQAQQEAGAADPAGAQQQRQQQQDQPAGQPAQPGARDDAAQPAAGRERTGATAGRAGQQSPDQLFVRGAASGGLMEVEAARLAQQKAHRQEVKEFAQKIIEDHSKSHQRLAQIAQSKQIQLPRDMKASHRAAIQELSELDGEQFEKAYVISNVGDHMKMVLKYRDASQNLQDPELKAFATECLPKLQEHLEQAQQLAGWDQAITAGARQRGTTDTDAGASPTGRDASQPRGTDTPGLQDQDRQPGAREGTDAGTDAGQSRQPGAADDSGASRTGETNR